MSDLQSVIEDLAKLMDTDNRCSSEFQEQDILKTTATKSSSKIPRYIGKGRSPVRLLTDKNIKMNVHQIGIEDSIKLRETNNRCSSKHLEQDILKTTAKKKSSKITRYIGKGPSSFSLSTDKNINMNNLRIGIEDSAKLTEVNNRCSSKLQKQDILKTPAKKNSSKITRYIGKGPSAFSRTTDKNINDVFDMADSFCHEANFDFVEHVNCNHQCDTKASDESEIISQLNFHDRQIPIEKRTFSCCEPNFDFKRVNCNDQYAKKTNDESDIISRLSFRDGQMPAENVPNLLKGYYGPKLLMMTKPASTNYGFKIPEKYLRQKKLVLEELKSKLGFLQLDTSPSFKTEHVDEMEDVKDGIKTDEGKSFETSTTFIDIFSKEPNDSTFTMMMNELNAFSMLTKTTRSIYGFNIAEKDLRQKELMLSEFKGKLSLLMQEDEMSPSKQLNVSENFMENIYTEEDELFEDSAYHFDIFSKYPCVSTEYLGSSNVRENKTKPIFDANSEENHLLQRPMNILETVIDSSENENISKKVQSEDHQNYNDVNETEQSMLAKATKLFFNIAIFGTLIMAINFLAEILEIVLD